MEGATLTALFLNLGPQPILWEAVRSSYNPHGETMKPINSVKEEPGQHLNFVLRDGILMFKGKVCIPVDSALQPLLITEFHNTPIGFHTGIHRILTRIASIFIGRTSGDQYLTLCLTPQHAKP
ncbi:hypothetical protein IHE45_13G039800 [Dioscorea alata]|uniref:Uncharacterized protein n=1 Tax=Dioscorea alata TaxID=55571 RepID=A0ACB7UXF2_DIOAL|nr:hypothetical protein IHE45_13G039800 [Dioscorea alata]